MIRQGELLSSICEYLGIPETGIPRLPYRWEDATTNVLRVFAYPPEEEVDWEEGEKDENEDDDDDWVGRKGSEARSWN